MSLLDHPLGGALAAFPELGRYRFTFTALDSFRLPPFSGSAWRGALGHSLRRTLCVTGMARCEGCPLVAACNYFKLFETSSTQGRHRAAPHPYSLGIDPAQPRDLRPDQTYALELVLVGEANGTLPYLVHALRRAVSLGIGGARGKLQLAQVEQYQDELTWVPLITGDGVLQRQPLWRPSPFAPLPAAPMTFELITPLRVKRQGQLLSPNHWTLAEWLREILSRFNDLLRHFGRDAPLVSWKTVESALSSIQPRQVALRWQDWTRYSSRQMTEMQMGGIVGEFTLEGDLAPIAPLLLIGEWVQLGKATSMGLGRYRMRCLAAAQCSSEPLSGPRSARLTEAEPRPC